MSESYKLPSRKNRTRPQDPQHRKDMLSHDNHGRWAHDKHAEDDPEDDPARSEAHPDLRRQPGQVKQALLDTGLDSTDDDDDEEGDRDEQEAQQQQRKKRKSGNDKGDGKEVRRGGRGGATHQQGQGQGSSGNNPFGALVRGKALDPNAGKANRSAWQQCATSACVAYVKLHQF